MKAFCEYNDYEIAGEYEDAGKSGKSIEGRAAFNRMLEDIKSGKDEVSFVLVFKLSRFGRNAADIWQFVGCKISRKILVECRLVTWYNERESVLSF